MDFHTLPRRELQALCKKNCIPANMTNVAMADALRALSSVEGMEELQSAMEAAQFLSPQKPEATAGADAPRTTRRTTARKLPPASVEPKEQQASPLPRSRRVTVKASEIMRLVAEGEGDKHEEKDLSAEQVVPQTPAAMRAEEMTQRTTRSKVTRKNEVKGLEGGGDGARDAIASKTPTTRTAGRRTTTRRAVATSVVVDEVKEEQIVAPSRTTRRTRQASKPPTGDSIASTTTLRRSTRARGGVSKMASLTPEEGSQHEKDVETVDSLDPETKLEDSDVAHEKKNVAAEICPSIADDGNQTLGEVEDEKQEQSVENKDSPVRDDGSLANKNFSEVLEEEMEKSNENCCQGHVEISGVNLEGEPVAAVGAICHGQEESNQEFSDEIHGQDRFEVFGVIQQEEQVAEVEAIYQVKEESEQADNSLSGLEGSPILGLVSSFEDLVISGDKQGVHDEDKSLLLLEAKDAYTDLLVGQEVGEKLSSPDFVNNEDAAGVQCVRDAVRSLEIGQTIDSVADLLVVQEAGNGDVYLEEASDSPSAIFVEGSGVDDSAKTSVESEKLSNSEDTSIDLQVISDSDDIAIEADSSSFQKSTSPASSLPNLIGSTIEILAEKSNVIKVEAFAEVENMTDNRCVNYVSQSQESDANIVKGSTESEKQKVDLSEYSLRKLKSLLKEKMSNDNQKVDQKRPALTQLNENCLQLTSGE